MRAPRFFKSYSLLFYLLLSGCLDNSPKLDPGLNRLALDFRAANQAEDIEPMLRLYALDGVDSRTMTMLRAALEYELAIPIAEISFEPLAGAPEETIYFTHEDIAYGPSLEPKFRMRVDYQVEDNFSSLYTIGQLSDGTWRIVSTRPLPKPGI